MSALPGWYISLPDVLTPSVAAHRSAEPFDYAQDRPFDYAQDRRSRRSLEPEIMLVDEVLAVGDSYRR